MENRKVQSITRVLGIICLAIVAVGQLFKNQTFIPQTYFLYLIILSAVLLSISLYLKAKSGGFRQYHLPIKMILVFILIVVSGIALIYYLTT